MEKKSRETRFWGKKLSQKKVLLILSIFFVIAVAGAMAAQKISAQPEFCTNCHNMQTYYDSWKDSTLLANQHAREGINCHDCHTPSLAQQIDEGIKQITGNYEYPMTKREFPKEMCLDCHTMSKVIAKTKFEDGSNPHESHQGEEDCNKCHNMHRESKVLCSQCHSFDWMYKLPPSFTKGGR